MLFYKLFSQFKIMGAIKGINMKIWYLNISATRQNIKNLIGDFIAIHVRIMHAILQASAALLVWEENEVTDKCTRDVKHS